MPCLYDIFDEQKFVRLQETSTRRHSEGDEQALQLILLEDDDGRRGALDRYQLPSVITLRPPYISIISITRFKRRAHHATAPFFIKSRFHTLNNGIRTHPKFWLSRRRPRDEPCRENLHLSKAS